MRALIAMLASLPLAACTMATKQAATVAPTPLAGASTLTDTFVHRMPQRNERVRVVFDSGPTRSQAMLEGWLYSLRADTLVLVRGPQVDSVMLRKGRRLQVVTGDRGHGASGLVIGGLAGTVAGAIIGAASYQPCTPGPWAPCLFNGRGLVIAGGATLGLLAGGLAGWLIGVSIRTQDWGTVELPIAAVSIGPTGVRVRASYKSERRSR